MCSLGVESRKSPTEETVNCMSTACRFFSRADLLKREKRVCEPPPPPPPPPELKGQVTPARAERHGLVCDWLGFPEERG